LEQPGSSSKLTGDYFDEMSKIISLSAKSLKVGFEKDRME